MRSSLLELLKYTHSRSYVGHDAAAQETVNALQELLILKKRAGDESPLAKESQEKRTRVNFDKVHSKGFSSEKLMF